MEFFVSAGGISVHVIDTDNNRLNGNIEEKDSKKCIMLLHGYMETFYIWSEFIDLLKQKYRIIAVDLPGHGLSGSSQEGENCDKVNTMAFDATVVKNVLEKCNVKKCCIGGHSMGGYVAIKCCQLYPDMFEKLILYNSNPYDDSSVDSSIRAREIEIIEAGKLSTMAALSIPGMYARENLRKLDYKIQETIELCETHDPEGIIASIKGMQCREDMSSFLSSTKTDVLVIAGEKDPFMKTETLEKFRTQCPNVKFAVIENTGHNSFIENIDESYQQTCSFIG